MLSEVNDRLLIMVKYNIIHVSHMIIEHLNAVIVLSSYYCDSNNA